MNRVPTWMLFFFAHAVGVSVLAQDSADLNKEKHFHNIYKKYNQQPTNDESWGQSTAGKQENYVIQKGDTLWSVSETLFGDPQFWPKVWSLNSQQIGNPHEVNTKQAVRFTPGTSAEPPMIALTALTPADQNLVLVTDQEKTNLKNVKIPEPEKVSKDVLAVPDSLPNWQYRKKTDKEKLVFDLGNRPSKYRVANQALSYLVRSKEVNELGEVKETELGLQAAGEHQVIYVNTDKPEIKTLLAVKEIGDVKSELMDQSGKIIQVQGEIELQDLVNKDKNLYRAIVKKSYEPIEVGAKLVAESVKHYEVSSPGLLETAQGEVIGGQFEKTRLLLSPGQVVFLAGKGYSEGHAYSVFKNRDLRVEDSEAQGSPLQIGVVKVIHTDGVFATAVLLDANEEILVGDHTERK